ncbi:hypothetical protein AAG906_038533 [Vitis piasezkii]
MGGVSLKGEEEALYAHKGRWNSKRHQKGLVESNATTSKSEDEWDAGHFCCNRESTFIATMSNKLIMRRIGSLTQLLISYDEHMVVPMNNSKLPITHIGNTVVSSQYNTNDVHFVLFGPQDVKVYRDLKIMEEPMIKEWRLESVYVMSAETAYVDNTERTRQPIHAQLVHVSYSKLTVMMKKSMLKGLPQLEVRKDTICAGCQYGKAHQYVWVYFMKEKSETFSKFKEFKEMTEAKKAIRCVLVGYDSQRKGWRCCDPTTGKCYTSRNVVFDESSSWWSSEKEILPDSNVFKDELQSARIQLSLGEAENAADGDIGDDETQSPWQTGVHGQPSEEGEPSETEAPIPLRISARTKKPNPKYSNVAIVEDETQKNRDICEAFRIQIGVKL